MTLGRCVVAALSFLLLAAVPVSPYQPYVTPQRLVDVGNGRRMNLYCIGAGSPTVILDTDQDDTTLAWRLVQPAVARYTRVCSYDAAGLGFSDPAPAPRDAAAYVRDLRTLLLRANIAGPYVLVGNGFSALMDRLYADEHPSDVAGMVFADPLIPYRNDKLASLALALKPLTDERAYIASLRTCRIAAAAGKLQRGYRAFDDCMWPTGPADPALPVNVRRILQQQWRRAEAWDDLIYAAQADSKSSAEVERAQRRYGNMPLVVLTSDVRVDMKGMPLSAAQLKSIGAAYQRWHRDVAALSSQGTEYVVAGSTNNMPSDHPAAVISAIEKVVRELRSK